MNYWTLLVILLLPWFAPRVQAAPNSLTYQGRILDSKGKGLNYNNVSFLFEILNPIGNCVIYREQKDGVNMVNSNGVFDVPIGSGVKLFPADPIFKLIDSFDNSRIHNCAGGSKYNAKLGDVRVLQVQFHDGSGWKVISPSNEIRSVPYAAYSHSTHLIGDKSLDDLLLKDLLPTCTNNTFLNWDGSKFICSADLANSIGTVTSVTSLTPALSVTNPTSTPTLSLAIGTSANTVAAGNDPRFSDARTPTGAASGDLKGSYPDPSIQSLQGQTLSLTGSSEGQFLSYKSNQWVPATLQASDVTGLSAMLAPYLKTADFNTAVANASCAAHQTMTYTSVAGFTCQSINVGLAGDVTGSIGVSKVERIQGIPVDVTNISAGQVLKYDGSSWKPANDNDTTSPGTVTSVTSLHAALSITNSTTTPQLNLSVGSTANTLAAGDDIRFSDARTPTGSASGDLGGNYPAPSVEKIQGQSLALTGVSEGQFLSYKSNQWVPATLQANDVTGLSAMLAPYLKTADFNTAVANASCAAHQTMTYTSVAGFTCQSINVGLAGDVTGSIGVSKVERIQGKNISATAPTNNQVLQWNGSAWTPSTLPAGNAGTVTSVGSSTTALSVSNPTTTPTLTLAIGTTANTVAAGDDARFADSRIPKGAAGGDLSGTYPNPSVNRIQGQSLALTGVTEGQLLTYKSNQWVPATLQASDVTGLSAMLAPYLKTADFNTAVANAGCAVHQTMTYTSVAGFTCQSINVGLAGDVTGSIGTSKVERIQGKDVSATAPTNNQVLQWNGSAWTPSTLPAGNPGTVTNVSATLPVRVTSPSSTPQISVDAATSAAKGVVQIGTGLSVDGTGLVSVNPATFVSAVPVNKGGTGVTSLTGDRLLASNASGSAIVPFNCPLGQIVSFDSAGKMICDATVFKNGGNSFGIPASIGTNDAFDLSIKTSNATRMTVSSAGNFAINSAVDDANAKLIVKASTTSQNPLSLDTVANGSSAIDFLRNGSWLGAFGYTDGASNDFYISNGKANALVFETQSKERMRLANSGFLGINEGTPLAPLHIGSFGTAGSKYSSIQLGNESTNVNNYYIANEVEGGKRFFRIKNGTASSNKSFLGINDLGHLIVGENGSGAGVLLLKPGTANHTYISFFARTATPDVRNAYLGFPNNGVNDLNVFNETAGGNINFGTYLGTAARNVMTLTPDGNAQLLGAYQNYSDRRLKREIQSLNNSLDDVLSLKPSSYFWKDSTRGETKQYGFIAQELEEVFPEIVTTNKETGIKTVSYMQLIAPLTKAIQEMYNQFHGLFKNHDDRLARLEEEMELLKAQNRLLLEQNQKLIEKIDSKDP
ncbi:cell wall surface anchor family protein [Bdellovibrio bacteriovorus W]|nr:cell wall surface anchor family protein [Bdellovibrio bacteriovorus W]